jgi:hypothetical protein
MRELSFELKAVNEIYIDSIQKNNDMNISREDAETMLRCLLMEDDIRDMILKRATKDYMVELLSNITK